MGGRALRSANRDQEIGRAVLAARGATPPVPWKRLEEQFDLKRVQLWRLAGKNATKLQKRNICVLEDETSAGAFSIGETLRGDEPAMVDKASCETCPHWRRRKEPDRKSQGRCMVAVHLDLANRESTDYCAQHPVLIEARDLEFADRVAGALARALKPILARPAKEAGG